jgi:hypothetical protein
LRWWSDVGKAIYFDKSNLSSSVLDHFLLKKDLIINDYTSLFASSVLFSFQSVSTFIIFSISFFFNIYFNLNKNDSNLPFMNGVELCLGFSLHFFSPFFSLIDDTSLFSSPPSSENLSALNDHVLIRLSALLVLSSLYITSSFCFVASGIHKQYPSITLQKFSLFDFTSLLLKVVSLVLSPDIFSLNTTFNEKQTSFNIKNIIKYTSKNIRFFDFLYNLYMNLLNIFD